jgi:hypothetical protein
MGMLDYFDRGLLDGAGLRADLIGHAHQVASAWLDAGVDPAAVEVLAEKLARTAAELGPTVLGGHTLARAVTYLELPGPVVALLDAALAQPLDARSLAALAVHLVDIGEAMAVRLFVAELPALSARADRTGDAARNVGVARHLKG